jgi:hypothetical protein
MRTVVYREHVSWQRRRRREVLVDAVPEEASYDASSLPAGDLIAALATLTWNQRAVVLLRFAEYLSAAETAAVLGVSDWRHLDVDGLVPVGVDEVFTTPVVRATGLDDGATRLAIPQPGGLVVVDLTSGDAERYDVPGSPSYVSWLDDSHVLVADGRAPTGTMVDLADDSTERSPYGPSTRVLADGSALTWDGRRPPEWSDGRIVTTPADNAAGYYPQPPLVRDEVVIGQHQRNSVRNPPPGKPPSALSDGNGLVAVDVDTGAPGAFLPLGDDIAATSLLGWAGDLPVVGLVGLEDDVLQIRVATWDFMSGELYPLAVLPSSWVAWGVGL